MGARDDDDIRKYMPDLKTIARTADPALAEERYREALNNPELDRALDDLRQGIQPGRAPFEFPVVVAPPKQAEAPGPAAPVAPGPAAPVAPVAPVAAATVAGGQTGEGPARGGAARVDVATPERPAATPPGATRAPSRDAAPPLGDRRRGTSRGRVVVLLAVAVLGPLATHQIFSRLRRSEAPVASAAPVAPSEAMTAPGRSSAEAPAVAAGASAGATPPVETGARAGATPPVDAGTSDEASPPKAGASAETPPSKAGASDGAPPPKAGTSARPAAPAPRAPAGGRPPPADVAPAPPEIAADIMH